MASGNSSSVWCFFTRVTSNKSLAICNLCSKTYKTSGNTTNLSSHLKKLHSNAYQMFLDAKNKAKQAGQQMASQQVSEEDIDDPVPPTARSSTAVPSAEKRARSTATLEQFAFRVYNQSTDDPYKDPVPGTSNSSEREPRQHPGSGASGSVLSRPSTTATNNSASKGGVRETALTQSLVYMVSVDNLPLSCVEKRGLNHFTRTAVGNAYKLPSRPTLTTLLERRYHTAKVFFTEKFKAIRFLSLTSDLCTITNSSRHFLVVTLHFVEGDDIESMILGVRKLQINHTAVHISEDITAVLKEFHIPTEKVVAMATDGAANIVAACRLLLGEGRHARCTAHLYNLICEAALQDADNTVLTLLVTRVKDIVTHFKRTNGMEQLRQEQELCGIKEGLVNVLIQEILTRWNATLDMLVQFVKLAEFVAKVLAKPDHRSAPAMLTGNEIDIVSECILLLQPYKEVTEFISGESYVTASTVIPMLTCLKVAMQNTIVTSACAKALKSKLSKELAERVPNVEINQLLCKATLLDPRYKKIHFESPLIISQIIKDVSLEVNMESKRLGRSKEHSQTDQQTSVVATTGIWATHDQLAIRTGPSGSQSIIDLTVIPSELKTYLDQAVEPRKSNPIKYWRQREKMIPGLACIALKYLMVPGSSVASERAVSQVNLAVPDNRSRITAEHINQRVFLTNMDDKYWFQ
ncbi:hypothetical protein B566_EDAN008307 [Ephemera danica]|nr:hypothetical protein B566_EDAN008307 [Ephemera danica]